jgi:hypothetical protein
MSVHLSPARRSEPILPLALFLLMPLLLAAGIRFQASTHAGAPSSMTGHSLDAGSRGR